MTPAKPDLPSPAKWALAGFFVIGLGSLLNGYQRFGSFGFAVGLSIGSAFVAAAAGWLAAHVKRFMSK
jgi:hypothetical protein